MVLKLTVQKQRSKQLLRKVISGAAVQMSFKKGVLKNFEFPSVMLLKQTQQVNLYLLLPRCCYLLFEMAEIKIKLLTYFFHRNV